MLSAVAVHACFTDASYTGSLLFGSFGLLALNCIAAIVNPQAAASLYGFGSLSKDTLVWTRGYGFENLAYATLVLSLLSGVHPQQAMGYMSVSVVAHTFSALFVTKDIPLESLPGKLMAGWMLFHGVNL